MKRKEKINNNFKLKKPFGSMVYTNIFRGYKVKHHQPLYSVSIEIICVRKIRIHVLQPVIPPCKAICSRLVLVLISADHSEALIKCPGLTGFIFFVCLRLYFMHN